MLCGSVSFSPFILYINRLKFDLMAIFMIFVGKQNAPPKEIFIVVAGNNILRLNSMCCEVLSGHLLMLLLMLLAKHLLMLFPIHLCVSSS